MTPSKSVLESARKEAGLLIRPFPTPAVVLVLAGLVLAVLAG